MQNEQLAGGKSSCLQRQAGCGNKLKKAVFRDDFWLKKYEFMAKVTPFQPEKKKIRPRIDILEGTDQPRFRSLAPKINWSVPTI